jgi:hypothetical protein
MRCGAGLNWLTSATSGISGVGPLVSVMLVSVGYGQPFVSPYDLAEK